MCFTQMGIGSQRRRQKIGALIPGRQRGRVGDAKKTTLSGGDTDDAKSKEKKKKSKKGAERGRRVWQRYQLQTLATPSVLQEALSLQAL